MSHSPSEPLSYSAEWASPSNPRERCGVSAGASGVSLWWRSGPTPNDEFGRGYTWDEWFEQGGTLDGGAPPGALEQIEALARRLGHDPSPRQPAATQAPRRRKRAPKAPAPPTWSAAARKVLQWSPGANAELEQRAITSGLHWVTPIGTTTYGCWIGVRQLGGVALERCPVVLCHGPNAATIATELRDSLAILLWWLGPRDSLDSLAQLRGAWSPVADEVLEQAEPFGGARALERFVDWLQQPPDPALAEPANSSASLRAVAAVISRLDPLQAGFREAVVALGEGREPAVTDLPRAWHEAFAATRFVRHRRDPDAAWAVAQGSPSLDTGVRLVPGHFVNTKMDWSQADPRLAAAVALRTPRSGPLARALRALNAATGSGGRYDGLAHLEGAAEAALAEDPATAWTLLAGAGYWTYQRFGQANPVIATAARQLAVDAGWEAPLGA